ncbi:hypothetical protein Gotur_024391 [Gossypium turneri]
MRYCTCYFKPLMSQVLRRLQVRQLQKKRRTF